jgi:hypothetical protein
MKDEVWTTKEGKKIKVGDMDTDHLKNVLRKILKYYRQKKACIEQSRIVSNEFIDLVGDDAFGVDFWKN